MRKRWETHLTPWSTTTTSMNSPRNVSTTASTLAPATPSQSFALHEEIFQLLAGGTEIHQQQRLQHQPPPLTPPPPPPHEPRQPRQQLTSLLPYFLREGCTNENPEKVWSFAKPPSDPPQFGIFSNKKKINPHFFC